MSKQKIAVLEQSTLLPNCEIDSMYIKIIYQFIGMQLFHFNGWLIVNDTRLRGGSCRYFKDVVSTR